jgi:catechol 2,3-dioxygenase-like lactoylglutathione lyase family enzyme
MNRHLSLVSLMVADCDEAIAFFIGALDFELCEDAPLGGSKRWVVVRPRGSAGSALLLARADGPAQGRAHWRPDRGTGLPVPGDG